jgi:hypothetical protein
MFGTFSSQVHRSLGHMALFFTHVRGEIPRNMCFGPALSFIVSLGYCFKLALLTSEFAGKMWHCSTAHCQILRLPAVPETPFLGGIRSKEGGGNIAEKRNCFSNMGKSSINTATTAREDLQPPCHPIPPFLHTRSPSTTITHLP